MINRFGLALIVVLASSLSAQTVIEPTAPTLQQILDRMMERKQWQERSLVEYRARRKFYASNKRFKAESTMHVETVFRETEGTQSTVTSHEGSKYIRSRVFDKILEAENETKAKKDKQEIDITPSNYNFSFVRSEDCEGQSCYRLKMEPKKRSKYSLDGHVWIDAADYSIVRIHGSPSKKPSFWTQKTEIDRRYKKIDGVWLPHRLDSTSSILIAGFSVLSIEYTYELVQTKPPGASAPEVAPSSAAQRR